MVFINKSRVPDNYTFTHTLYVSNYEPVLYLKIKISFSLKRVDGSKRDFCVCVLYFFVFHTTMVYYEYYLSCLMAISRTHISGKWSAINPLCILRVLWDYLWTTIRTCLMNNAYRKRWLCVVTNTN